MQPIHHPALTALDALDLTYLIETVCSPLYPLPRWQREAAERSLKRYKHFLWLQHCHRDTPLVPKKDIDEFWHNHILFTENYTRDCLTIFGYYLHHRPALPTDDLNELKAPFELTKSLYEASFHEPY